jgi:hypothetical protein
MLIRGGRVRRLDPDDPLAALTLEMLGVYGVSTDPKKEEMLLLEVADPDRSEVWEAKIHRHPDRPLTLGPWEETEVASGRMARLLENAFNLAGGGRP